MAIGRLITLLLATAAPAGSADAACNAVGARYAPRSSAPSRTIRYRMTIVSQPSGLTLVAERYRFELFNRFSGRRVSSVDLDVICGNGRAPCATWAPGGADPDSIFRSAVVKLDAKFIPVHDWQAAHAIIFPRFSENDWATSLSLHRMSNVHYYTRPHVEPDLSEQIVWVRTACGRG